MSVECSRLFFILASFCFSLNLGANPIIIAHRGASNLAPENTVESAILAWQVSSDAIEIDIRVTKDNQIVAYHDDNTERIGGRKGQVNRQTLAELQDLDVGSFKGKEYRGAKIPTLEQVLHTVPANKLILLELKSGPEIIELLRPILGTKHTFQIGLIGFDYHTMSQAKDAFPELDCFWIVHINENINYQNWPSLIDQTIDRAVSANLDGLILKANAVVSHEFVSKSKKANLEFFVYTINSGSKAKRHTQMGVDGIITDRPRYIRDSFN